MRTKRILLMLGLSALPLIAQEEAEQAEVDQQALAEARLQSKLEQLEPLFQDSPFLTPAYREHQSRQKQRGMKYQVHGYAKIGDQWMVSLYHAGNKSSLWLAEGEEVNKLKVVSIRPKDRIVEVLFQDRKFELPLPEKK